MNTFSDNPEPQSQTQLESAPAIAAGETAADAAIAPAPLSDPIWTGLDVFRILLIGALILLVTVFATLALVPGATFRARTNHLGEVPELLIVAQMLAYVLLLGYMYILVKKERGSPRFWKAIHWNWPRQIWPYLLIGMALQIVLLAAGRLLPLPKQTPFDALLRRPTTVVLIAAFAVTLGPLMEELFFRGFLYAVLARRFGVSVGISFSAFGFGLMHAAQYGYSWASIVLIFLVGIVLGIVRAVRDSVAAGFIVHAAYNGTIILMMLVASDGLRHLEKLSSP